MTAESLPSNHDIVAVHCGALGALLIDQGCFDEAERLLRRAEPMLNRIGGDHSHTWSSVQRDLVRLYERWLAEAPRADLSDRLAAAQVALSQD
ncbi:hypothetical protein RAS1_09450 [Phycisphaerae bacterium RAS1]|nr:hypothetical protein RAS1_09450 [Phycisphaerae bacterium RAS1]